MLALTTKARNRSWAQTRYKFLRKHTSIKILDLTPGTYLYSISGINFDLEEQISV
jgi:hypothetical protein